MAPAAIPAPTAHDTQPTADLHPGVVPEAHASVQDLADTDFEADVQEWLREAIKAAWRTARILPSSRVCPTRPGR
jgi:hypothetical protein